jgi:hypothetical protein
VRTATVGGFVDLYVRFLIHVHTRWAGVAGGWASPTRSWVPLLGQYESMQLGGSSNLPATNVLIVHDTKDTGDLDAVYVADGCEVKRVGPRAPNLNANAER